MPVIFDLETDGLVATKIWCICTLDTETGEAMEFLNAHEDPEPFKDYAKGVDQWIAHNGLGFDVGVVAKLIGADVIEPKQVTDTLVLSRLFNYNVKGGHSLKAWGQRLGFDKGDYSDWSKLTPEMVEYCHRDCQVTLKLYQTFEESVKDPAWALAIETEHQIQTLCEEMTTNGFKFNEDAAEELLGEIVDYIEDLEGRLQYAFPPKLEEVRRLQYKVKADGEPFSTVTKAREKYFQTIVDVSGDEPELVCKDWVEFNPASPKMRIDRLWAAGWKPVDRTKGHLDYLREQGRERRAKHGY